MSLEKKVEELGNRLEELRTQMETKVKALDDNLEVISELLNEMGGRLSVVEAKAETLDDSVTATELDVGLIKRLAMGAHNAPLHAQKEPVKSVTTRKFNNTGAKRVLDTQTNTEYASLGAAARAVCKSEDLSDEKGKLSPDDNWVWYRLIKIYPSRFTKLD